MFAEGKAKVDMDNNLRVPVKRDFRFRDCKRWKVEVVMTEHMGTALPIPKVYLRQEIAMSQR
jgi:hypothetical protein